MSTVSIPDLIASGKVGLVQGCIVTLMDDGRVSIVAPVLTAEAEIAALRKVADAAAAALVDLESAYHLVPGYCDCLPPGCMAPSIRPLRAALAALEATR